MLSILKKTDARHVQAVLSGDRDAYAHLVRRHWPAVRAVAFSKVFNDADADDVAQIAFIQAYEKLDTLSNPAQFRSWITTIARNYAVSMLRSRKDSEPVPENLEYDAPSIDDADVRAVVRAQLESLDEAQREVLLLHYDAGMNVREIGATLNISTEAAKKRLQRARAILGESLARTLEPQDRHIESHARKIMAAIAAASPAWLTSAKATTAAAGATTLLGAGVVKWGIGVAVAGAVVAGVAIIASQNSSTTRQVESTSSAAEPNVQTATAQAASGSGAVGSDTESETDGEAHARSGNARTGIVVDDNGKPIPDQVITIAKLSNSDAAREVTSGADGKFTIPPLHEGRYAVVAHGDGIFAAQEVSKTSLDRQIKEDPGFIYEVVMAPSGPLTVSVYDDNGDPLPNARILGQTYVLRGAEPASVGRSWNDFLDYRTDAEGIAEISHLWKGRWAFAITHDDYATTRIENLVIRGSSNVADAILHRGAIVRGVLMDQKRETPVANANVIVRVSGEQQRVTTDAQGKFEFAKLPAGEARIDAGHEFYTEHPTTLQLKSGETYEDIVVYTHVGGAVTGKMLDSITKEPIAGMEVRLSAREAKTNTSGVFVLRHVFESSYAYADLNFRHPEYANCTNAIPVDTEEIGFGVQWSETTQIGELEIVPGAGFDVILHDAAGSGVEGAVIMVAYETERCSHSRASIDEVGGGTYRLRALPPGGTMSIFARDEGMAASRREGIEIGGPSEVRELSITLDQPLITLSGAIRHDFEYALTDLNVSVHLDEIQESDHLRNTLDYTLKLISGVYSLRVIDQRRDYSTIVEETVVVAASPLEQAHDILLYNRSKDLVVYVKDEAGDPVSDANLTISTEGFPGSPHHGHPHRTRTDASGYVELPWESAVERVSVRVEHEDYISVSQSNIDWKRGDIEIALQRGGIVEGVVFDARTRKPLDKFEVGTLYDRRAELPPYDRLRPAFSARYDEYGKFSERRTKADPMVIVARAHGYAPNAVRVDDLSAGNNPNVEIPLYPESRIAGTVVDERGKPIEGAYIILDSLRTNNVAKLNFHRLENPIQTDAHGKFSINRMPVGKRSIYALHTGMAPAARHVTMDAGEDVAVDFVLTKGGSLRAALTLNGAPVDGEVSGIYIDTPGFSGRGIARSFSASTVEGFAQIHAMPEGHWWFGASTVLEGLRLRRVFDLDFNTLEIVDVSIDFAQNTGTIRGTIGTGIPPGVYVVTAVTDQFGRVSRGFMLDDTFELPYVQSGSVELMLSPGPDPKGASHIDRGVAFASTHLVAGDVFVWNVEKQPGGSLSGTVSGGANDPHRYVYVTRLEPSVLPSPDSVESLLFPGNRSVTHFRCDSDDTFSIAHLPAGEYSVTASASNGVSEPVKITIAPGSTNTIDMVINPY